MPEPTRPQVRVNGETFALGDTVMVSFDINGPLLALVGVVTEVRRFDQWDGTMYPEPLVTFRDWRTDTTVTIERSSIMAMSHVDGPWSTDDEVQSAMGPAK